MKFFLKKLVTWLIRVTPKPAYCYMKGLPSFDDSLLAIYRELPIGEVERVVWSVYSESDVPPFSLRGDTRFVKKGSLLDFYYGIVSRWVFTTHGHFVPNIPENQVCVNVWHGMPFKAVGLLNGRPGRMDTLLCSTSELYQDVLSRVFGMPKDRILTCGIPRNDLLVSDAPEEVWRKAGVERSKYTKVFVWLPTYRKAVVGDVGLDGVECGNVYNMQRFPEEEFEAFLREENCLCIIKPHPMAPRSEARASEHVLVIDEDWMWRRGLTLYPLIGQADFLVSDISSVMVDYSLLHRPMIVCFADAEEYKASRNVVFDSLEDWLPGEIVDNYMDLLDSIRACVRGEDRAGAKREGLLDKFHAQRDFSATAKLLERVFGKESEG